GGRYRGEHPAHVPDGLYRAAERAGDLGLPGPRVIRHVGFRDPPARLRRPHHHLERVAEPPVRHRQGQQRLAPGGAHRTEIPHRYADAAAQLGGQDPVADPGVQRPGALTPDRAPPHHEIGLAGQHRVCHRRQVTGVERGVGVHDAHHVAGRGEQARVAGGTEAALRDVHDTRTVTRRYRGRVVDGAVVRDDGPVPRRHPGQDPGQCACLVEARQDNIYFHGARQYLRDRQIRSVKGLIGPYEPVTVPAAVTSAAVRRAWL